MVVRGEPPAVSTSQPDPDRSTTGPDRLRPVVRLLLVTLVLVALGYLASLVPTLSRPLGGTSVTVATALLAVVAVVAFGLLVALAHHLGRLAAARLDGPAGAGDVTGAVVRYVVVFLALVAVYDPVERAMVPFLADRGAVWVFDLLFTAIALGLLLILAALVARNLDPLAALLTRTIEGNEGREGDGEVETRREP